jgi:hypothetical protein
MRQSTVVRARIDERTKNETAAVLAAMGLTVSDAFRLDGARRQRESAPIRAADPECRDDPRDQGGEEGETQGLRPGRGLDGRPESEGLSGRKRSSAPTSA